jgi:hypothetical protein
MQWIKLKFMVDLHSSCYLAELHILKGKRNLKKFARNKPKTKH